MSETNLGRLVERQLSRGDTRLFRNQVGTGWQGKILQHQDGILVLENPRLLTAGLVAGSGDHVGWRSLVITPAMVGKRLAQFVSIEEKFGRGVLSKEQKNWIEFVNAVGGRAGVAWSVEEARDIIYKEA